MGISCGMAFSFLNEWCPICDSWCLWLFCNWIIFLTLLAPHKDYSCTITRSLLCPALTRSFTDLSLHSHSWRSSRHHWHQVLRHSYARCLLVGSIFNINEALAHSSLTLTCSAAFCGETLFMSDSPPWRGSCWHTDILSLPLALFTCMSVFESHACQNTGVSVEVMRSHL